MHRLRVWLSVLLKSCGARVWLARSSHLLLMLMTETWTTNLQGQRPNLRALTAGRRNLRMHRQLVWPSVQLKSCDTRIWLARSAVNSVNDVLLAC